MLLGQLKRNALYAERRLSETRKEIRRATEEDVSQNVLNSIQERIDEYQEEKQDYDTKSNCLKLREAVFLPCTGFGFILIIYSIKDILISSLNLPLIGIYVLMILGLVYGVFRLILTLRAIEYASTNIPFPEFDIFFMNGEKKFTCYAGETTSMDLLINNRGYLFGELIEVTAFLPKGCVVSENENYITTPQGENDTYPEAIGVCYELDIIHVDTTIVCEIGFIPPSEIRSYQLPVWVNEKNITQKEFMLELEVLQRPPNLMNVPQ